MEQPRFGPAFVGIDVFRDRLGIHVLPSRRVFAVSHAGAGFEQLAGDLRALVPAPVVLEATGRAYPPHIPSGRPEGRASAG